MTTLTDDFAYEVLSVVAEIPEGRVATYGQIAQLVGKEKNARLGRQKSCRALNIMAIFPVIASSTTRGGSRRTGPEQAFLLFREGVDLKPDGCVDLKKFQWD